MKIFSKKFFEISRFSVFAAATIVPWDSGAADAVSQFEREMLSKPAITQPSEPFVEIFLDAGCDGCSFGFQTNGAMTVEAWKRVFTHVGYLSAYSFFKPFEKEQWKAGIRDVAPTAAQALGRNSGGVVMGLPSTPDEIENIRSAYRSDLGLGMTHFFHDDESDFGLPGGSGLTRLKLTKNAGYLKTNSGANFVPNLKSAEDSFVLKFGLGVGDYIFGGDSYLMGHYAVSADKKLSSGWVIKISNSAGYFAENWIVFETADGHKVVSLPFNAYVGRAWLSVTVEIRRASTADKWDVKIAIEGVGDSSGTVGIPQLPGSGSGFVVGNLVGQTRDTELDDIRILASSSGGMYLPIAEYFFEPPVGFDTTGVTQLTQVSDDSGRGHILMASNTSNSGLFLSPTTGIKHELGVKMKQYLVDDILSARRVSGKNHPVLITNWLLSDRPGQANAWKNFGFTHGSSDYYYYDTVQQSRTKLATVLLSRVPMELREKTDSDLWAHAWIGNAYNEKGVFEPDDFASLVVMATLEGYRWFSTFVAMSNGHLAMANADKTAQVHKNAEAIYAMAKAASWFQDTSARLSKSIYFSNEKLPKDDDVLIRSRINRDTNEMWFAGCLASSVFPGGMKKVDVSMPASKGAVVNMATGEKTVIDSGVYQLTVSSTGIVYPYYFTTDQSFGATISAPKVRLNTVK